MNFFLFAIFAALNLASFYTGAIRHESTIFNENGLVENVQAACFFVASIALFASAIMRRGFDRWLTAVFSVVCLTFFWRELDVRNLNLSPLLQTIGGGAVRNWSLLTAYAILASIFIRFYRHLFLRLRFIFLSKVAMILLAGCGFYVVGEFFEMFGLKVLEEIAELNGAFLILVSALVHVRERDRLTRQCTQALPALSSS